MKKFSKKLIWYRLIANIFPALMVGFLIFTNFLPEEDAEIDPEIFKHAFIISCVAIIVSYILLSIYQVLYYKCSGYELKDNEIICVKGVFFKKKSIVEYKKIHAVNSKQNIIEKIFGISVLQVDSGSTNTADRAEVQIIEEERIVNELIKTIKAKQNNEEIDIKEENNNLFDSKSDEINQNIKSIYNFDSKKKAIYTALQVAWVLLISIVCVIAGLFVMVVLVLLKEIDIPLLFMILGGTLAISIIISLISFVFGLIGSILTYYNFNLRRNNNDIEISYGLITKINNTFKYNRIKAIRINQSIIQKIFGFVTIKVEVVGYTAQTNNEEQTYTAGILVPLCKKSEVNMILENILPDYIPLERKQKSTYYFPFVSYNLLFSFIVFAIAQIILTVFLVYYQYVDVLFIVSIILWFVYLLYISIVLIDRKLAKNNSGFSIQNDKLCIYRGSFIEEIIVMRNQNIIGIDAKTTFFRRKKNIYTYNIHFKSNASTNTVKVLNVDKNEGDKLYELIKY